MGRGIMSPRGRDQRSLARQLEEDDAVIVLNRGRATKVETGGGINNALECDSDEKRIFPEHPSGTAQY